MATHSIAQTVLLASAIQAGLFTPARTSDAKASAIPALPTPDDYATAAASGPGAEVTTAPKLETRMIEGASPYIPSRKWDRTAQKRYKALAVKEALGKISEDECNELNALTEIRRNAQSTRSADQILWEYRQRKVTNDLLQILDQYVEFHSVFPGSANSKAAQA